MTSDYNLNPRKIIDKHPSCVEVGECRPPRRGGKNTSHWCKGKVGIPHTWEWLRDRNQLGIEQRMKLTYNRITEVAICFGCEKDDHRYRHYCDLCGTPWTALVHVPGGWAPCVGCGAAWMVRHVTATAQWSPHGSVTR
jgi:hypothetical protein